MGDDLSIYRCRIGNFNKLKLKTINNLVMSGINLITVLSASLILTLLLIGNIELNPGPTSEEFNILKGMLIEFKQDTKNDLVIIKQQQQQYNQDMHQVQQIQRETQEFKNRVTAQIKRIDSENRKNNLVLYGVEESSYERNCDTCYVVCEILARHLGIHLSEQNFNDVFRIGRNNNRPIMMKLNSNIIKQQILDNVIMLKGTQYKIDHDYNKETRETRKKLLPFLQEARRKGNRANLVHDKIKINGRMYNLNDLENNKNANSPLNNSKAQENWQLKYKPRKSNVEEFNNKTTLDNFEIIQKQRSSPIEQQQLNNRKERHQTNEIAIQTDEIAVSAIQLSQHNSTPMETQISKNFRSQGQEEMRDIMVIEENGKTDTTIAKNSPPKQTFSTSTRTLLAESSSSITTPGPSSSSSGNEIQLATAVASSAETSIRGETTEINGSNMTGFNTRTYHEGKNIQTTPTCRTNSNSDVTGDGIEFIIRIVGDEETAAKSILRLPSATESETDPMLFMLPGLEGLGSVLEPLAKNLRYQTVCLQLGYKHTGDTIQEMAKTFTPYIQSCLAPGQPFNILGYSFGGVLALEIVLQLEESGLQGNLYLVDSSPDFMKMMMKANIGLDDMSEDELNIKLTCEIFRLLAPKQATPQVLSKLVEEISPIETIEERIKVLARLIPESDYSIEFQKSMHTSITDRLRAVQKYEWLNEKSIKSRTVLIRPPSSTLVLPEDYGLSKICNSKVEVDIVPGNHVTILESLEAAAVINKKADIEDASFFEKMHKEERRQYGNL